MRPEKAQPNDGSSALEETSADETTRQEAAPAGGESQQPAPAPSPSSTPEQPAQPPPARETARPIPARPRGRRTRMALVLLVVLLALLGYGAYWLLWLRGTVTTDDAYVDARIVSVSSRLPGRVGSVPIKEGDQVKMGQVLVNLATSQMLIRRDQARAEVDRMKARLQELRNGPRKEEIRVARSEVQRSGVEMNRRRDLLRRMEALAPVQAISEQELEQQRAQVELGRVELEMNRRKLELMLAGTRDEMIAQARADLDLAEARLADVEADLKDLVVMAPVEGVVARRMVDPGEFVEDGQGLMQIVETGHTWVVANLEEGEIEDVRPGQRVDVNVDAYPGRTMRGRVSSVYSATLSRFSILSTTSTSGSFIKVTQRVPVRIEWDENQLPDMYPGLNVVVRIHVSD